MGDFISGANNATPSDTVTGTEVPSVR